MVRLQDCVRRACLALPLLGMGGRNCRIDNVVGTFRISARRGCDTNPERVKLTSTSWQRGIGMRCSVCDNGVSGKAQRSGSVVDGVSHPISHTVVQQLIGGFAAHQIECIRCWQLGEFAYRSSSSYLGLLCSLYAIPPQPRVSDRCLMHGRLAHRIVEPWLGHGACI